MEQVAQSKGVDVETPGLGSAITVMVRNARAYISRVVRETMFQTLMTADDLRDRHDLKRERKGQKMPRPVVSPGCVCVCVLQFSSLSSCTFERILIRLAVL